MMVAYNMSEIHQIRHILKGPTSDMIVLGITFFLTVFADLTVAVEFGLLAAAVLFIKRMSDIHRIEKVLPDVSDPRHKVRSIRQYHDCPQLTILNIEGALFFGAAQKFEQEIRGHLPTIRTLILRMGRVPVVDSTGERALHSIWDHCKRHKVELLISGLQPQPTQVLESTGLLDIIGRERFFPRTGPAIDAAIARMDLGVCRTCPLSAFRECDDLKMRGALELAETR
jgi:SulP family sulfate permease